MVCTFVSTRMMFISEFLLICVRSRNFELVLALQSSLVVSQCTIYFSRACDIESSASVKASPPHLARVYVYSCSCVCWCLCLSVFLYICLQIVPGLASNPFRPASSLFQPACTLFDQPATFSIPNESPDQDGD